LDLYSPRPQVGALPYRKTSDRLEFLLVTSASRGRWIIPKGNIEPHLGPQESARMEALEEGGVSGFVHPTSLGTYLNDRPGDVTKITVFPLRVDAELPDARWAERSIRKRAWFTPLEARERLDEPDLKVLITLAEELLG
jgi:8-oxo-dGTP pyrophosphatase MutT (NUDIX family)